MGVLDASRRTKVTRYAKDEREESGERKMENGSDAKGGGLVRINNGVGTRAWNRQNSMPILGRCAWFVCVCVSLEIPTKAGAV